MVFSKLTMKVLVSSTVLLTSVEGHSWIHCSDYRGDTRYYDETECYGHPRPMGNTIPSLTDFGVDQGFNQQPGKGAAENDLCHGGSMEALSGYPNARYRQGETITLAWPSKNHVAEACTNPHIPDTSLELFVAAEVADGHPTDWTQVSASFSDDPHVKDTIDHKGFQNCPAFCENMDKSLCTGSFQVPDLPNGMYTFMWKWEFNEGTTPYVTCFEAYVGEDVSPVARPTQAPTVEGQTPEPVAAPTLNPNADCVGMYQQCAGGNVSPTCCSSGSCFKQSEHYSQCLEACPAGGWECNTDGTSPVTPTPNPTEIQPPVPTSNPTEIQPPVPSSDPTMAPTVPVTGGVCQEGSVFAGVLKGGKGKADVSAILEDGCDCAKFCTIFAPDSTGFMLKKGKCSCYERFKKMIAKNSNSFVGEVPLNGLTWAISE